MKWAKSVAKGLLGYRPASLQVGALCLRIRDGKTQVLLITSRDTGRWVIPKGWPMRGRSLSGAAKQEAWEKVQWAKLWTALWVKPWAALWAAQWPELWPEDHQDQV